MKNYKTISVETTYLEMLDFTNNNSNVVDEINSDVFITKIHEISVNFYKFLYNEIGGKWGWSQRLLKSDKELENIINNPKTSIYVLYLKGVPSGFAEYQQYDNLNFEIKYFGLLPKLNGKGLGKTLLNSTLAKIKELKPKRIFLQTCVLDSPSALLFYKKNGFEIYDKKICEELYPIDFLENCGVV